MHPRAAEIVAAANRYVGCRYRHQGRTSTGIDCAGVIICVGNDVGVWQFDTEAYSSRPNVEEFNKNMQDAGCVRIEFNNQASGDILRLENSGWPVHLGILEVDAAGCAWMIHAWATAKKVLREELAAPRIAQISQVWRYP